MGLVEQVRALRGDHGRSLRLLAVGFSLIGYLLLLRSLIGHGIVLNGGAGGGDILAYWVAGGNLIAGRPVYSVGVGGYAAFLYPPPLAQVFGPLSYLPFPVVVWLWRAIEIGCLRLAVGSWTRAGIAILVWPPVIAEVDAGNVHLLIAAAVAGAIRGLPEGVCPIALTKFATLATVPMAVARSRRGLLRGCVIAVAIVVASVALSPTLWRDYVSFMRYVPTYDSGWYNLGQFVPLWARLSVAGALAIAAIRWARLAALSATLALPVLWFHGLSVLVAMVAGPPLAPVGDTAAPIQDSTPIAITRRRGV